MSQRIPSHWCDHPEIALRAEHIRAPRSDLAAVVFLFCTMCGTQGWPTLLGRPAFAPPRAREWPEAFIAGPWDLTN